MGFAQSKVQTQSSKLVRQELCDRVNRCFGAYHTMLPYLHPSEQITFQGLDRWIYEKGVPRAQKSIVFGCAFYCQLRVGEIWEVQYPSSKVTLHETDIQMYNWNSVRVGQDIFQAKDKNGGCRWLSKTGPFKFTVIEKARMNKGREFPSYCNMQDQFIFVTAGLDWHDTDLSSVERYSIARDVWEEMPQMNVARFHHSSCTLGTTVYVLCGINDAHGHLNLVEKLETRDLQAGWQAIQTPLTQRSQPIVAALNQNEILIMGGQARYNHYDALAHDGQLSDALALDINDGSVREIGEYLAPATEVISVQSLQVRPGVVVVLIVKTDRSHRFVQYKDDGSVKTLQ